MLKICKNKFRMPYNEIKCAKRVFFVKHWDI